MRAIFTTVTGPCMVLTIALALGGCGLGAGATPGAVQVKVTRDFGAQRLPSGPALKLAGQETVMSLLERNYAVTTRFGGGFVQSIDGLAGGRERGQPVDWFYYVNGVEATTGAATRSVDRGDHIWWDHHDWSQTDDVPAVVGSFPEPFLNGLEGKRLPVRVECASLPSYACATVTQRLQALGVPAAVALLGSGGEPQTLRVMVGPWLAIRGDPAAHGIEAGPAVSGVYGRFAPGGGELTLLDQDGRPAGVLRAGAGLIAATRQAEDAPVWVVTGTDQAGLQRAAGAFQAKALADHFALALAPGGALALPVASP